MRIGGGSRPSRTHPRMDDFPTPNNVAKSAGVKSRSGSGASRNGSSEPTAGGLVEVAMMCASRCKWGRLRVTRIGRVLVNSPGWRLSPPLNYLWKSGRETSWKFRSVSRLDARYRSLLLSTIVFALNS